MKTFNPLSTEEQLALHLRDEIIQGGLGGVMPGAHHLAEKLQVSPKTVFAALKRLEHEGLLEAQGPGRRSRIVLPDGTRPPGLRVEILRYEKACMEAHYMIDLKHKLELAGHSVHISAKTLLELRMDVKRVAQFVHKTKADAWLVTCGSRPVLEWFAAQSIPAFGLFGCIRDVPMAGFYADKIPVLNLTVRRLAALGHQRIVMIVREERRKPSLGAFELKFLEALEAVGIRTGSYNLPDWQDNVPGLLRCLDTLFQHTPPTALIIDEGTMVMAARLHLAQRGILSPRDVSILALDHDHTYDWCEPQVSYIAWNPDAVVRRVQRWADNVARGKEDHRPIAGKARVIEGGTIGPAPALAARKS